MKDYYILAKVDFPSDTPHSSDWPKIIAYSYEYKSLLFLAGKGHGVSGFELPASEAGDPDWTTLFLELNATWIPDFLKNSNFSCLDDFLKSLKKLNIPIEKMQA
ncbi:hypothetical protein [Pseudomonas chlororaphis]|uniref:Uncharacterized protein n=1 Tax=Pseudomonas chlororaphis TaxID=587753 RepID=A0AAX3G1M7_9PSED|nr:hypothetical protein [Pseudomonas chlororaphis]AZC34651.1 hypothetical protein C4K37_0233 [Pseudomonas chlororaphis subsp. piscium]AZC41189.1 hypothetical protein C4K36_0233 [Pseudomonas chlororaphis subsp. piscium]MBP5074220.1 hypothetical protein [Pseudomonas chlororaphis]WDG73194.1 hypothetical protein PUP65_02215 [Pseudomonas chlororaphis]WDG80999.1 hypothetical protein PUP77_09950 [Pseudomonas chlororaphis]